MEPTATLEDNAIGVLSSFRAVHESYSTVPVTKTSSYALHLSLMLLLDFPAVEAHLTLSIVTVVGSMVIPLR